MYHYHHHLFTGYQKVAIKLATHKTAETGKNKPKRAPGERKPHRRKPRRGCRGRIPTNILVGGDINGNVPTNIRGGNVVEYELLIAIVDDT